MKKIVKSNFWLCLISIFTFVNILFVNVEEVMGFSRNLNSFSENTIYQGETVVLNKNQHIIFPLNVDENSLYCVKFYGNFQSGSILNISIDSKFRCNFSVAEYDYKFIPIILGLETDNENITINVASGKAEINAVTFIEVSSSEVEEFVAKVNGLNSASKVKETVTDYSEKLKINFSDVEADIFYSLPAYAKLLDNNYGNVNDIIGDLFSALYFEKNNPSVKLSENGNVITQLKQAKLDLLIKRKENSFTTFPAVYDQNGKLVYVGVFDESKNGDFQDVIDLSDEPYAEQFSFKMFTWESLKTLIPKEKYNGLEKVFYISGSGNDSFDGSQETPFATLARAKEEIKKYNNDMQGDIVFVLSGKLELDEKEVFTEEHSGKNGYKVIFIGDKSQKAVIDGGKRITGWQPYRDGIYRVPFNYEHELRELYINGTPAIRARSKWVYKYEENFDDDNDENKKIVTMAENFPNLSHPEEAELVWKMQWVCQRTPVLKIEKINEKNVITLQNFYQPDMVSNVMIQKGKDFYIENGLELLDEPGEFYYSLSDKMLYYYPMDGEKVNELAITVPISEGLIQIEGSSLTNKAENITFDGITFKNGTWNQINNYPLLAVQAGSAYSSVINKTQLLPPAQFNVKYAKNIDVINCTFESLGSNALALDEGVSNAEIMGNVFKDIGGGAISIGNSEQSDIKTEDDGVVCKNIKINNNVIRRTGTQYRQMPGLTIYYGNGIEISNNDIADISYSGISLGWGWNNDANISQNSGRFLVKENRVRNVLRSVIDGGNIYTLGQLPDTIIENNYFDSNLAPTTLRFPGIFLDSGSRYIGVQHNVVTNCGTRWLLANSEHNDLASGIYGNYTDGIENTNQTGGIIGDNTVGMTEIPKEAESIINQSGLKDEYKVLLLNADISEEKVKKLYDVPEDEYYEGILIDACDFADGEVTDCGENYVSFNFGDWVKYDFDVKESGIYTILAYAAIGGSDNTISGLLSWSCSTSGVYQSSELSHTGGYEIYKPVTLGEVQLEAGQNSIMIQNIKRAGCHLRKFILKKKLD